MSTHERDDLARLIHESHFSHGWPVCNFPARPGLCQTAGALADSILAAGWTRVPPPFGGAA